MRQPEDGVGGVRLSYPTRAPTYAPPGGSAASPSEPAPIGASEARGSPAAPRFRWLKSAIPSNPMHLPQKPQHPASRPSSTTGFTLVEVMVSVFLLGLLGLGIVASTLQVRR